jgi:hypothetical protein
MTRTRRRGLAAGGLRTVAVLSVVLASACSTHKHVAAPARFTSTTGAPLPATAPYLLMSDRAAGLAVWPSGHAWLLLGTTDGWRHVANRTPVAVPTAGGLVAAASSGSIAVAIGTYERLTRSPFVTSSAGAWRPSELPGAVSDSRGAVSIAAGRAAAVIGGAGGTVVTREGRVWTRLTDASKLIPGGGVKLDSVTWADARLGWLTGHGTSGDPMAFRSLDGGHSWLPVSQATGASVAALAPCGAGSSWLLPVVFGNGTVRIYRTTDSGMSWLAGDAIPLAAGAPAWGCREEQVWMAGRGAHVDQVFASNDAGQSWVDVGAAPRGLTDLAPTGDGAGYAASITSGHPALWSVTRDGRRFTSIALPGWVATIGAQMGPD